VVIWAGQLAATLNEIAKGPMRDPDGAGIAFKPGISGRAQELAAPRRDAQ